MSWRGCTCTLREDSPFSAIFTDPVPIKSILPSLVRLEGLAEPELAYMLAWEGCSLYQRQKVAELVTSNWVRYMDAGGDMPIRISQTTGAAAPLALLI